jgi:hypothetical protein
VPDRPTANTLSIPARLALIAGVLAALTVTAVAVPADGGSDGGANRDLVTVDDPRVTDPNYEGKMARASATPDYDNVVAKPPGFGPPDKPAFIGPEGFIRIPQYDDRNLSDAERAAAPVSAPGATGFAACLAQAGILVDVREPLGVVTDAELREAEDLVNEDGPFVEIVAGRLRYVPRGHAEQFLACANRHLTLATPSASETLPPPRPTATTKVEPSPPPAPPPSPVHDPSMRSGIAELDAIVQAVLLQDNDALVERAATLEAPCVVEPVTELNASLPRCQSDEAPGTLIPVFPYGTCVGLLDREVDFAHFVSNVRGLYAIVKAPDIPVPEEFYSPIGEYWLIFAGALWVDAPPVEALVLYVDGGSIVRENSGCASVAQYLESGGTKLEAVVPPPEETR